MSDQLLALVSTYGAPALFGIVAIAAIGVPLPINLLLVLAGAMISQGAMNLWWAIALAGAGSILGDQAGYAIGRWGGAAAARKFSRAFGKRVAALEEMEGKVRAWGGPGIFVTRWLLSALGPGVNLASGTAGFPWRWFLFWDVLGELTGTAVYISLGRIFSDHVIALYGVLGDLTWAIVALLAAIILGYMLFARLRRTRPGRTSPGPTIR